MAPRKGRDDGRVRPARIDWTGDGQPRATDFGDVYFSRDDGLAETHHVFLEGNRLAERWARLGERDTFVIGETGFGTGLNLLAAQALFLSTAPADARLHVLSVEQFPLDRDDLARALEAWPDLGEPATELLAAYPTRPRAGFHRLVLAGGRVRLTLVLEEAGTALEQLMESGHPAHRRPRRGVDAWFLDGFAPARNPAMWRPAVLAGIRRLSAPGATFATFTAAGDVRRGLEAEGFDVEKAPGFGTKRDMLRGRLERPRACPPAEDFPASPHPNGRPHAWHVDGKRKRIVPGDRVAVIGGGLAGCHAARALAERGLRVTLLEAEDRLAQGGSGNQQGVLYAKPTRQGGAASEFNLAALAFAQRHYAPFWNDDERRFGERCGVLHLAGDDEEQEGQRALAEGHGQPALFTWLDRKGAGERAGMELRRGGLWFPDSGWLNPPALCDALVRHPAIETRQARIATLEASPLGWTLLDPRGEPAAEAVAVVLACATGLSAFEATAGLPVQPVRGQVSRLHVDEAPTATALRIALCGDGYLAPVHDGRFTFGATFVPGDTDTTERRQEHEDNLARLRTALPDLLGHGTGPDRCTGRAALRCATPDRLPLAGPVPDATAMSEDFALLRKNANAAIAAPGRFRPGLFVSAGYGSRGLAYIPLATESLVADLTGEPTPLGPGLRRALHPARFLIRDLKRGRA